MVKVPMEAAETGSSKKEKERVWGKNPGEKIMLDTWHVVRILLDSRIKVMQSIEPR